MADRYDLIPDLAKMIEAALFGRHDTVMYGERIAAGLGLGECDSREVIEAELRKALPAPRAADEDQPLTCVRCWNSPASRLLVIHWREETIRMLCGGCAEVDAADARDLPAFRMATVLTIGTLPAPGAPGWQKAAAGEPCLTDSQRFQVDEARDVLVNWGLVQAGVTSRESVLADQVRALLAIVDQAFPGDPVESPSGPRPFRIRIGPSHLATVDRPAVLTDPTDGTVADTLGNWWHLAPPAPRAACLNCGADLTWAWDTSAWARADEPERGREICRHPDGTWKPHVVAAPAAREGKGND